MGSKSAVMQAASPLLSRISVCTFLLYSKAPVCDNAQKGRSAILNLKQDGPGFFDGEPMVEFVARRLAETAPGTVLERFFHADTILVPAPGHAPRVKNQLWALKRFAEQLVSRGLGREVWPILDRTTPVPKSAFVRPGEQRPTARLHASTIRVDADLTAIPSHILIVDDVLTRGATMLGCASVLAERFPFAKIEGLAIARNKRIMTPIASPIDPGLFDVVAVGGDESNVLAVAP